MNFFRSVYKIWVLSCFILVFLLLLPFFALFAQRDSWKPKGHFLNRIWAHTVFLFCFLPCEIEYRFYPKKKTSYVYCPNHSSFLDIPSLCYSLPGYYLFLGKDALARVPLFGYMFRNYYIPVDRKNKRSKYDSMIKSFEAVDKKRSLAIFPEGTIPKAHSFEMSSFKDGPFRIAIEKQIPIVPITIPYNWLILPDDGKYIPNRHLMKVIVHEPLETKGMTIDDLEELKNKTFSIIDTELRKQNAPKA